MGVSSVVKDKIKAVLQEITQGYNNVQNTTPGSYLPTLPNNPEYPVFLDF